MRRIPFRTVFIAIAVTVAIEIYFTLVKTGTNPKHLEFSHNAIKTSKSSLKQPHRLPITSRTKSPLKQKEKLVLFYTKWFNVTGWPVSDVNGQTNLFQNTETFEPCEYKCRMTYNRNDLDTSDAVMFHARDLTDDLDDMVRNRKNFHQRWIYHTHENPYYSGREPKTMNGFFNWTMTQQRDSDIYFPYFQYRVLRPDEVSKIKTNINHAHGRTNLVTWSVSNCETFGLRNSITRKLTEFIPIVINGGCAPLFPKRKNISSCGDYGSAACSKLYQSTKFYLSFENGICPDYVTEKYYKTPIKYGMVPIVYGPQENYEFHAIPGSYINLYDFPSIEALANYIKYLDKNDAAYNEYFKWKTKYKIIERNTICKFCEQLHDETLPRKTMNDFESFYGRGRCDVFLNKVRTYL